MNTKQMPNYNQEGADSFFSLFVCRCLKETGEQETGEVFGLLGRSASKDRQRHCCSSDPGDLATPPPAAVRVCYCLILGSQGFALAEEQPWMLPS